MKLVPWSRKNDVDLFFRPVLDLSSEMDKFVDSFFSGDLLKPEERTFRPNIEISEDDKAYTVKAELPGLDKDDVKVTLDDNVLTIKGEKKREKEENKKEAYYKETYYGSFCRRIPVQYEIDEKGVKAKFKNGLLTLNLPKKEVKESKPLSIDVE